GDAVGNDLPQAEPELASNAVAGDIRARTRDIPIFGHELDRRDPGPFRTLRLLEQVPVAGAGEPQRVDAAKGGLTAHAVNRRFHPIVRIVWSERAGVAAH